MTPFFENLVRGAASVTLLPSGGYDIDSLHARFFRESERRGVPFDTALIARIAAERFTGMIIFTVLCLTFIVSAVTVASWGPALACVFALVPSVLFVAVILLEQRLPA
jgi:hypothetical protein